MSQADVVTTFDGVLAPVPDPPCSEGSCASSSSSASHEPVSVTVSATTVAICLAAVTDQEQPSEVELTGSKVLPLVTEDGALPPAATVPELSRPKGKEVTTKPRKAAKRQRGEAPPEDTAAADGRIAFRHAQRLLRKNASSVDLKSALHHSFLQQHERSQTASLGQPLESPSTPLSVTTPTVRDLTDGFLNKVHETKSRVIHALMQRELSNSMTSGANLFPAALTAQGGAFDGGEELVLEEDSRSDDSSALLPPKVVAAQRSGNLSLSSRRGVPSLGIGPFASLPEDSRSSVTQNSPPMLQETSPLMEDDILDRVDDDGAFASVLQRKHQLLKFQRQLQDQPREKTPAQVHGAGAVMSELARATSIAKAPVPISANTSRLGAPPPLSAPPTTVATLLRQRSVRDVAFHVSETDMSLLKRSTSAGDSQSAKGSLPVIFRR